jgi:hypothetical protein
MQLVYLEWHDATCSDSWEEADDAMPEADDMLCRSIGWLVDEADGFITVCHTHDAAEHHVRGAITIPANCIVQRINFETFIDIVAYTQLNRSCAKNISISTTATPAKSSG